MLGKLRERAYRSHSQRGRHAQVVEHFGSEYATAVEEFGGPAKADAELAARERRFAKAQVRPLSTADRDRFLSLWQAAQARFVDSPAGAIADADGLIEEVMALRGYPVGDRAQRLADVAIGHPHLLDHYREAWGLTHGSREGEAGTEELRQALVHYRALFEDLLEVPQPEPAGAPA